MSDEKIIIIEEVKEKKRLKEEEISFYKDRLTFLQHRVSLLEGDIKITKEIIRIIENESVIEVFP